MNNPEELLCKCQTPSMLVSDANCPIKFDAELNEYSVVSRDGTSYYRMYYCFFCGGKLPQSKRTSLFTEPSEKEARDVSRILAKARSIKDALRAMGEADEVRDTPLSEQKGASAKYVRHHVYSSRWKSLDLTVREREDGSFDVAYTGKYKGDKSSSKRKRA